MTSALINGREATLPDDPEALLVDVLRDGLRLTGTKLVCGAGVCGACTVLLDGVPVASCLLPAKAAAGRSVTTVEGVGAGKLHAVQRAFMALDALQCGFCTPGFIVEASAFHDAWRAARGAATPTREEIARALSGHLCRCGAYDNIFRAVADACSGKYDGDAEHSPRVEARQKVTGAAVYTVDIRHEGQLEGVVLRSPHARARVGEIDLEPARAIPASPRPFPSSTTTGWSSSSASRSPRSPRPIVRRRSPRWPRSRSTTRSCQASSGREAARKARRADPFSQRQGAEGPTPAKAGPRRRHGRQCPRADRRILAQEKVGARLDRERQGGRRSAPVRGDVPDRGPAAHLPRAACGDREVRRRRTDHPCLDPVRRRAQNEDRQAFQARSAQGSGRRRAHRRRLRLEERAWRRERDRGQARQSRQGAGQGRVRPA